MGWMDYGEMEIEIESLFSFFFFVGLYSNCIETKFPGIGERNVLSLQ